MPRRYHPLVWILQFSRSVFDGGSTYSDSYLARRRAHYKRVAKGPGVRERMRLVRRKRHNLESTLKNPALRNTKWTAERYGINWSEVPA